MIILAAFIILAGSMVLSILLTALARIIALRLDFVARPRIDRYHQRIVPMMGGLAIFGTLLIALVFTLWLSYQTEPPEILHPFLTSANVQAIDLTSHRQELWVLLACVSTLFTIGLWDDKFHLGPMFKLVIQIFVAVTAAYLADMRVELFIHHKLATAIISALWIVIVMNAFNFLDNMDGAATGIAAIVGAILLVAAMTSSQIWISGLALTVIGSLCGFLLFNFPPAQIFMGDAGSLVLGFMIAILSLRTTYFHEAESGDIYRVFIPLIALSVPLYDFISVTTLRILQGKSPFVGDTQHFSHRLKRRGLSDRQTVLTLYFATLCTGLGATFLYQVNRIGAILIAIQTIMVLIIIAILEANVPQQQETSQDDKLES